MKKRAVIVCPGRGSYTKSELGYIKKFHPDQYAQFIQTMEQFRKERNLPSLLNLDQSDRFVAKDFYHSQNAADLIHLCSYLDFSTINRDKFDIVGITGNSMGWYITLHMANVLSTDNAVNLIHTMATSNNTPVGIQVIFPIIKDDWKIDHELRQLIYNEIDSINIDESQKDVFISIEYGGYLIIGATKEAGSELIKRLPKKDIYPLILPGNSAFHTPLLKKTSDLALTSFSKDIFRKPNIPLIDGRGKIWEKHSTNIEELYAYTLGTQVVSPYNFSKAIEVAYKEFAPDVFILTGPGNALGGATAQALINVGHHLFNDKNEFIALQSHSPYLISMNIQEQRSLVY